MSDSENLEKLDAKLSEIVGTPTGAPIKPTEPPEAVEKATHDSGWHLVCEACKELSPSLVFGGRCRACTLLLIAECAKKIDRINQLSMRAKMALAALDRKTWKCTCGLEFSSFLDRVEHLAEERDYETHSPAERIESAQKATSKPRAPKVTVLSGADAI